jgi:hypothetical protein
MDSTRALVPEVFVLFAKYFLSLSPMVSNTRISIFNVDGTWSPNNRFTARYFDLQVSEGNHVDRSKAVSHMRGIRSSRPAPRQSPRRHPNPETEFYFYSLR